MNQDVLRKIQQIEIKKIMIEKDITFLENQVNFIEKANRHNITVECVTMVPDPDPERDDWGWSGPPMKERKEVRNYSIDKEVLLASLREKIEGNKKLLAQFQKEFDEL